MPEVVGEAFVAVIPVSAGFGAALEAQLQSAGLAQKVEKQLSTAGVAGGAALSKGISTEANKGLSDLEKQFANTGVLAGNSFTSKVNNALKIGGLEGGQLLGAAVVLGTVAALAAVGEAFAKARKQIAAETGATGDALNALAASVTKAFREVPVSLSDAASAVDQLFRRGIPLGPQLDKLAEQALFLAKISREDLSTSVESTSAVMSRFNVPLGEQSRELDVLFKGYQQSGKSLGTLTQALLTGGLTLQSFGFNLDQSVALLANLEKHGANIEPILAGLRLAFGKITTEGGNPATVLQKLVTEFTDGTPRAQALSDAVNLFGKRSGAELAQQLAQGNFSTAALLKTITDGRDGIVATGLATLTLGDQFKLFANNAVADFSNLGTSVLQGLERTLASLGPPVVQLAEAFGHLGTALAPALQDFGPFLAPLALAGPLLSAVAKGVDTLASGVGVVASALGSLPTPLGALIVGAGLLAVGVASLNGTFLAGIPIAEAYGAAIDFATGPIGLTIAALAALGIAARSFGEEGRIVAKTATDIGNALFDVGSKTSIFNAGITSAAQGLQQFLEQEAAAGEIKGILKAALIDSGTTVDQLAKAVAGGAQSWAIYRQSVIDAATGGDPISLQAIRIGTALDEQRKAFQRTSADELTNIVLSHQLSAAQVANVEASNRNADGTVNYGKALDAANAILVRHAQAQDQVILSQDKTQVSLDSLQTQLAQGVITDAQASSALKALGLQGDDVTTTLANLKKGAEQLNQEQDLIAKGAVIGTAAYGDLTRQIAQGSITQDQAVSSLTDMGFSATGAGQAFSDLSSQVTSFVNGAVAQLPTAGQAIQDFSQQLTTDASQLSSDQQSRADLQDKINSAVVGSSNKTQQQLATINLKIAQDQQNLDANNVHTTDRLQSDLLRRSQIIEGSGRAGSNLATQLAADNAKIIADFKKLVDDQDPAKFINNLLSNTQQVLAFTTNLQKLVSEGFAPLAAELAKQGPKAAGVLAGSLAGNESKAAIANKAVELGKTASDKFQSFLEANAPELLGTGAKQGAVIGKAIADGITNELLHNFPFLKSLGITTGQQVLDGATSSVSGSGVNTAIVQPIKTGLVEHIPEFRGIGVETGSAFRDGADSAGEHSDLATTLKVKLQASIPEFRGLGVAVGTAVDVGVSAGVIESQAVVGAALITLTNYGVTVTKGALKQQSPSKVFAEIGANIGAGLAVGITSSQAAVGRAISGVADATVTTANAALSGIVLNPRIAAPTITPVLVPPKVDPVKIPTSVEPIVVPPVAPVALSGRFGPITVPVVPAVTVPAALGPLSEPTFAPVRLDVSVPPIPAIAVPTTLSVSAPVVPSVVVPAALAPLETPTIAPVSIATTIAPLKTDGVRAAGESYGATIGAGIAAGIERAAPDSGELTKRFAPTLPAMNKIAVPLGVELAHGIGIGANRDEAALKKFLEGLSALPKTPPSDVVRFAQTFQSLPVDAPQHRADAQHQLGVARSGGPFDGATLNFPEKTDPLHLAHELAWLAHGAGIET